MNTETEVKQKIEGIKINKPVSVYRPGMSPYVLLPLCALGSTFICTGGWRSGLRATLLWALLLLGLFLLKKLCFPDGNWKKRTLYFAIAGIPAGLSAALIIWALELAIGSPTLSNNPYNQDTGNLFLVCPLYGFFMLGGFGLAFNLSRMSRYFIVLAGAALANTFGLIDLAPHPDFVTYILGILINCVKYYIPCLGNCIWFVFLWLSCAESIFKLPVRKKPAWESFGIIILGGFVAYILFMIVGVMASGIMLERYIAQHSDTVFEEKLTGIIVFPNQSEYYDFKRKDFYDIPMNVRINKDFNSNDGQVKEKIAKKINLDGFSNYIIVNDTMYYKEDNKLFSLHLPEYDKPEVLLKKYNSYHFYISPDEKFIAYYGGVRGFLGREILCVMNLKTKKILALKASHGWKIFWINNLDELKMPKVTVIRKKGVKK